MADAFGYNYKLKYLNISTWETANCTNMAYMFQELRSLPEFNITNFDTSKVTAPTATSPQFLSGMMIALKELDLSSFDTNNVTNIYTMFSGKNQFTVFDYDTLLEKIYVSEKFTVANVTDKTQKVFEGNYNIVGGNGTKYSEDRINVNYAIIDNAIYDENGNYISGEQGYFTKKQ